jgi:23S rRNA pseudouridine1911/1915/1917 synthase
VILPASITADAAHDRMRLDVFISIRLAPEYSRSQVARMIKAGLVTVNGAAARASSGVRAGDRIEVAPPAASAELSDVAYKKGDSPEINVLFADDEIIVVDKPAGMTVHPAPGHPDGTLVDGLLWRFPELATMAEPDGVLRPGIVHRLDKDTSGVMVIARTPFARTALSRQFKERSVRKIYLAIVKGIVARDQVTIERPVGRHPIERKKMSVRSPMARDATSRVTVLRRFEPSAADGLEVGASMVRVKPETGRMHQIRVHLASIGHPCLGDRVYGGAHHIELFERQALHALALSIAHPRSGERVEFLAPLPADFATFLARESRRADTQIDPDELRRWIELD